ncbi:unnamed protein product [Cyclocybe aegerita]|uniref:Uncharacterized protein n=1 Tax=Cyclocybe aegerita TaxID=1973307 RepID=A0A8S0WY47_CYCAE|nr:unnamed protein product [Cyclocybe aegerita]
MNERYGSAKVTLFSPQRYRDHERCARVRELHLQPGRVQDKVGTVFQRLENPPTVKQPSMWRRFYQTSRRRPKPATGWEQARGMVQELIEFMHSLKNVERLYIRCNVQQEIAGFNTDSFDAFESSMPLILAGWTAYGLTLRSLTLDFPLEAMSSVLLNGQHFLPSLEALKVIVNFPDEDNVAQFVLTSFIDRHSTALQFLTITMAEDIRLPSFLS